MILINWEKILLIWINSLGVLLIHKKPIDDLLELSNGLIFRKIIELIQKKYPKNKVSHFSDKKLIEAFFSNEFPKLNHSHPLGLNNKRDLVSITSCLMYVSSVTYDLPEIKKELLKLNDDLQSVITIFFKILLEFSNVEITYKHVESAIPYIPECGVKSIETPLRFTSESTGSSSFSSPINEFFQSPIMQRKLMSEKEKEFTRLKQQLDEEEKEINKITERTNKLKEKADNLQTAVKIKNQELETRKKDIDMLKGSIQDLENLLQNQPLATCNNEPLLAAEIKLEKMNVHLESEMSNLEEKLSKASNRRELDTEQGSKSVDIKVEKEEEESVSELDEHLLGNPDTSSFTVELTDATKQLVSLNVKQRRPRMSKAEKRRAVKAKYGQEYDPKKFDKRKNKGAASRAANVPALREGDLKRSRAEAPTPPTTETQRKRPKQYEEHGASTSAQARSSFREALASIKMAVVPKSFPEDKFSKEQGTTIQKAIINKFECLEDGSYPIFSGSYMEKGALIVSCSNLNTKTWLVKVISSIRPLGEDVELIVGNRKDILRATKVFLRAPINLSGTPERIRDMLDKQNPSFRVKDWKTLEMKEDPKGRTFVFLVDVLSLGAIKASECKAHVGLWQVSLVLLSEKDNAEGPTNKPLPQKGSFGLLLPNI